MFSNQQMYVALSSGVLSLIIYGHLLESSRLLRSLNLEDMKLSDCLPDLLNLLTVCRLEGKNRVVSSDCTHIATDQFLWNILFSWPVYMDRGQVEGVFCSLTLALQVYIGDFGESGQNRQWLMSVILSLVTLNTFL